MRDNLFFRSYILALMKTRISIFNTHLNHSMADLKYFKVSLTTGTVTAKKKNTLLIKTQKTIIKTSYLSYKTH